MRGSGEMSAAKERRKSQVNQARVVLDDPETARMQTLYHPEE